MITSKDTGELAKAMAKAQVEMRNPKFDAVNPHFRNKFASLAAIRDAVIPVFSKYGIAVSQEISSTDTGIACTTILMHESGQWAAFGPLVMPASKNDAQGRGSAATYAKRYSLQSVAGVVGDEDDDAEAAQGRRVDPADSGQKFPEDKLQAAAGRILDALNADLEEPDKAAAILAVQADLVRDQEFFAAAWKLLGPKERKAFKAYVDMARREAA